MNLYPLLEYDPMFKKGPLIVPVMPSVHRNPGACVIIPGGNLEFCAPSESICIGRWVAESLGIPAMVAKVR